MVALAPIGGPASQSWDAFVVASALAAFHHLRMAGPLDLLSSQRSVQLRMNVESPQMPVFLFFHYQLGHKSVTTTERHYARWVKGGQDLLDDLVSAAWKSGKGVKRDNR